MAATLELELAWCNWKKYMNLPGAIALVEKKLTPEEVVRLEAELQDRIAKIGLQNQKEVLREPIVWL